MKLSEFPSRLDGVQINARAETIQRYRAGKRREQALEEVVLSAMRDGVYYLKAFAKGRCDDGELVSIAYTALNRAAIRFDPKHGTAFMTFAKAFLRGALFREWKKQSRAPAGTDSIDRFDDRVDDTDGESEDKIIPKSLQEEPDFDAVHLKELWKRFEPYLNRLSPLERQVIDLRYMRGLKFSEIAELLHHRKQNYQAIHQRAIRKLRLFIGVKEQPDE
jgi:RNA polymerase sigma factor (sigma-70 family)